MKRKKSSPPPNTLHFILLVCILGLLILCYSYPWAVGKAVLIKKTVYVHKIENLSLMLHLVAVISVISFLYSLITSKVFGPGIILLVTGGLSILLSLHVWDKIIDKEVAFLGIDPLKIVSVRPDIGLLLFFLAGVVVVLTGFVYLVELFIRRK